MARTAFAVGAHPDDIEFFMAGTLLLLKEAGYEIHTMNISNGSCGSGRKDVETITRIRREESLRAAEVAGSTQLDRTICGSAAACHLAVVEHSGCYAARCSHLRGFRLGSNAGNDADQGHGEERREFIEVGSGVELAGISPVAQSVAEGVVESCEVGVDMASSPGVERCSLDSGVAHETTAAAGPPAAGFAVAGEGLTDLVRSGFGSFDWAEDFGEVFLVVALERCLEESLLGPELGIHGFAVDTEFGDELSSARVRETPNAEQLDSAIQEIDSVVLLCSAHRCSRRFLLTPR